VNPHTTKQTPQANHQPSTASSNLRARRDTLALAPALAERLTKDSWKVAPEKAMGKKNDEGGQIEYETTPAPLGSLLSPLFMAAQWR
jgi:hypothetical protein